MCLPLCRKSSVLFISSGQYTYMLDGTVITITVSLAVCVLKRANRWMELCKLWYWRILQKKKKSNDLHHHFIWWPTSFSVRMHSLVPVRFMHYCVLVSEMLCFPHTWYVSNSATINLQFLSYSILALLLGSCEDTNPPKHQRIEHSTTVTVRAWIATWIFWVALINIYVFD